MRVAVTGGNGVMGRALAALRPHWLCWDREDCDVSDAGGVEDALQMYAPDVVVHAAAITDHACPDAAALIETNVLGTRHVARECTQNGIPLVYLSTHYVYAGVTGNYAEYASPRPIGAYAWSKWAGERYATDVTPKHNLLIVRGSWYNRATRLDRWAAHGALVDAWCSREPVEHAARKVVALVEAKTWKQHCVVNIGGERRTFEQILLDEGYAGFPLSIRDGFDSNSRAAYPFPVDTSVDTARFDALGLAWRVH